MGAIESFILRIKRRENKFYVILYDIAKFTVTGIRMPVIKPVHISLYYIRYFTISLAKIVLKILWWEPLFRARCNKVGTNLSLPNGIPYLIGHVRIFLGDNVAIYRTTIGSSKVAEDPMLRVGNNSSIGYGTTISIGKEVTIGDNCMIGGGCLIMDNDDHPVSPEKRKRNLPVEQKDIKPVKIGNNVWIGTYATILKGVTIGHNSVVAAHSVVTKDIRPNCVYAGSPPNPIIKTIDEKE